jgi:hypothetical protein
MNKSWDRQAAETEEWYDRFALYLYMGPTRTVAAAHAFATRFARGAAQGQPDSWRRAARRYDWKRRAAAFDAELCRKSLASLAVHEGTGKEAVAEKAGLENAGRDWTGEERLRMVSELLRQVYAVLRHADLLTMTKEEARQLLPTLRLFFRDLLTFYQTEAARFAAESGSAGALDADDFMTFMKEMGGLQMALADLSRVAGGVSAEDLWRPLRDVLAQLYPDESSARRMAAQAHLDSARIHFSARAIDSWHAIMTEASHAGMVERVIDAAQREYGTNAELTRAVHHYRQARLQESKELRGRKKA